MSRIFKHDGGNRPARKKSLTMLVSLALILLVSVGGTLAYLVTQTDAVENTFTPAKNDITVEEEFDNQTKKNVGVTNNSDFAVFVRMQIVETWMEGDAIVATPRVGSSTQMVSGITHSLLRRIRRLHCSTPSQQQDLKRSLLS